MGQMAVSAREALPQRRAGETFDLRVGNRVFSVTIGRYADDRIGEIFINGAKVGSEMDAVCRDAAVLLSIALQHGVPVQVLAGAITREGNGEPSSIIGRVLDQFTWLR